MPGDHPPDHLVGVDLTAVIRVHDPPYFRADRPSREAGVVGGFGAAGTAPADLPLGHGGGAACARGVPFAGGRVAPGWLLAQARSLRVISLDVAQCPSESRSSSGVRAASSASIVRSMRSSSSCGVLRSGPIKPRSPPRLAAASTPSRTTPCPLASTRMVTSELVIGSGACVSAPSRAGGGPALGMV